MADFRTAFPRLMQAEGGYVHNPADPGGETKFGISKRAYPHLDIAGLTIEDAEAIYKKDYWDKIRGDDLDSAELAANVFDFAVNAGVVRAVKTLQSLVGAKVDGKFGDDTLLHVQEANPNLLCNEFTLARIKHYVRIVQKDANLRAFLLGWVRRALEFA